MMLFLYPCHSCAHTTFHDDICWGHPAWYRAPRFNRRCYPSQVLLSQLAIAVSNQRYVIENAALTKKRHGDAAGPLVKRVQLEQDFEPDISTMMWLSPMPGEKDISSSTSPTQAPKRTHLWEGVNCSLWIARIWTDVFQQPSDIKLEPPAMQMTDLCSNLPTRSPSGRYSIRFWDFQLSSQVSPQLRSC
jgi:hypothetical protein